jgi:hypothetical protein
VLTNDLRELPPGKPIVLENSTCVYCGTRLEEETTTKEHVLGRRFVPKGTLNQQWNLIVRACKRCNSHKSKLENDISAITMQPNAWGKHADEEKILAEEARRKGKNSFSKITGRSVANSQGNIKAKIPFSRGVEFNFNFTSPPQVEESRVFELARLQLMAFFYFITYNKDTKTGSFWMEGFYPLQVTPRSDWGNDVQVAFMKYVISWEPRWIGNGAEGYFKSAIRRHPESACWSWALEWNKNYRIIGFFGEFDVAKAVSDTFPRLKAQSVSSGPRHNLAYRIEKKLKESEDLLFAWDDGETE